MTDYNQLATRWAPINYQYINLSDTKDHYYTKQDLVIPVNQEYFQKTSQDENGWSTMNNRERLEKSNFESLVPVVYYSIAETQNHYYILYSFFHADDTTHPNDMEGCMVIIEKPEKLLSIVTVAHHEFPKYIYDNTVSAHDAKPLMVETEGNHLHPLVQQESGKHGMYGLGENISFGTKIVRWIKSLVGIYPDIVVYYPNGPVQGYNITTLTKFKKTPHYPTFYYHLVDIHDKQDGLIDRRNSAPNSTFDDTGKFYGGAANPPWLWKDSKDYLWEKPAELAAKWFQTTGKTFDTQYTKRMEDSTF